MVDALGFGFEEIENTEAFKAGGGPISRGENLLTDSFEIVLLREGRFCKVCLIWALLVLAPLISLGQSATVKGSAPNFIGQELRLVVQDDPISGEEVVLAATKVSEDGSFSLSGNVEAVQYGFLQVGRECGDLFLERGKTVVVRFAPLKRPKGPEAFSDRYFFKLDFIDGDGAKLNRDISHYNMRLDAFLASIYPLLKKRKNPKALTDSVVAFRKRADLEFTSSPDFVKQYIIYALANVEQTFVAKRNLLFDRYLKAKEPQPFNPEYMKFINQFYDGQVERMALIEQREVCIAIMKKSAAFAEMEELLMKDPYLADPFIRKAILIQGMEKLYGQKGFDNERLSATLTRFSQLSSNSVLAKAAGNIAKRKDRIRVGTPAPDFKIVDTDGKAIVLSELRKGYVLVEFTDAANAYCQQESAVLRDMQKRFQMIQYVTVCVGNSSKEIAAYKPLFAPARPVGSIARNHPIVTDYGIMSLPAFFIIDADGRFYRSPALDPSKGGISELEVLHAKLKTGGRTGQ